MALVKYNNNSISAVTSTGIPSGALTLIKTLTASASATLSFVDGTDSVVLDSTYPIYKFEFINIQPASDGVEFNFNLSTDAGSNYNVTKTSTAFRSYHMEDDSGAAVGYRTDLDLAQGTGVQNAIFSLGNGADESAAGELYLFNPSDTTFVKHYISTLEGLSYTNLTVSCFIGGYANTTSAVDAIQFSMSSGNINAGTIKLYGIKDS